MSGCYCETVYDGYCGHCFDEVERERDEARECLREIITGFAICGCNSNQIYSHNTITKQTLNRWRKAAGMEEEQ